MLMLKMFLSLYVHQGVQKSWRSVSCQTSPLCPPEWTLDSSPLSHQTTGRVTEALRSCGGSKFCFHILSTRFFPPSFNSTFFIHTLTCFCRCLGFVAVSQAVPFRCMTQSWQSSREGASEPQLDHDWPVLGTHGTKTNKHSAFDTFCLAMNLI